MTFLRRVKIRNYKSIAACDVALGPLTFLVGPNGAGKSNFLDALRFVADALNTSLERAALDRGGILQLPRRGQEMDGAFGIRLEINLPEGATGHYALQVVSTLMDPGPIVVREECSIRHRSGHEDGFDVRAGLLSQSIVSSASAPHEWRPDRLYLAAASGQTQFAPLFDGLSGMHFYNLEPRRMRQLQPRSAARALARDGSNVAGVLHQLAEGDQRSKKRIQEYLAAIVPGIEEVRTAELGGHEGLEFVQPASGAGATRPFPAANMSDGTLRALGVLVALFQPAGKGAPASLVGIEEPELALHPAAAEVLLDAMHESSLHTQVIVTTQSPDLLDNKEIETDTLLAVAVDGGTTKIGPVDEVGRSVLRDRLFTPGELLRLDQLAPGEDVNKAGAASDLELFDSRD